MSTVRIDSGSDWEEVSGDEAEEALQQIETRRTKRQELERLRREQEEAEDAAEEEEVSCGVASTSACCLSGPFWRPPSSKVSLSGSPPRHPISLSWKTQVTASPAPTSASPTTASSWCARRLALWLQGAPSLAAVRHCDTCLSKYSVSALQVVNNKVLGSRDLARYYRQKHRPESNSTAVVCARAATGARRVAAKIRTCHACWARHPL